jgi:hypothetical protein
MRRFSRLYKFDIEYPFLKLRIIIEIKNELFYFINVIKKSYSSITN